jgi:glycosyltransferase involved in cell wall biosynthesis
MQLPHSSPPSLRVGIDATCWLNRRGYGRFAHQLLQHLVEEDGSVDYTLVMDFDPRLAPALPAGVHVHQVETAHPAARAAAAAGRRGVRDMWAVSHALSQGDFDLIFFPTAYTYVPVFTKVPVAVVIHDVIAEHFPQHVFPNRQAALFWRLKLWAARRQAGLLMTVSEASRQGIAAHWNVPQDRIQVICEAADPLFRPIQPDTGPAGILSRLSLLDRRFVLYVGGISPHKNLGGLIDAMAALRQDASLADLVLVLVGDYTSDVFFSAYEQLRRQRDDLKLHDTVVFAGYVPDAELVHLYSAASAFVLPSLMEGFGLPAIEAMACGAPVIVSNRGALPEVVGGAGLVYDPDDARALPQLLRRVLREPDLNARLRRDGPRRAAEYSWRRAARDTLTAFRAAVGSRGATAERSDASLRPFSHG